MYEEDIGPNHLSHVHHNRFQQLSTSRHPKGYRHIHQDTMQGDFQKPIVKTIRKQYENIDHLGSLLRISKLTHLKI